VEETRRWGLLEEAGHWGVPLEDISRPCPLLHSLSLCLLTASRWAASSATHSYHHDVLPHHGPKAMEPVHHGRKSWKLWAKINLPPLGCFLRDNECDQNWWSESVITSNQNPRQNGTNTLNGSFYGTSILLPHHPRPKKRAGGVALVVECLPSKHKVKSSNPSATKKPKQQSKTKQTQKIKHNQRGWNSPPILSALIRLTGKDGTLEGPPLWTNTTWKDLFSHISYADTWTTVSV
jgi:hypothetical protein